MSVLIVSVAMFLFGWLWYSVIAKDSWMKAMRFSKAQMNSKPEGMGMVMLGMFLLNILTVYVIGLVAMAFGATSFMDGAMVGLILWVGFSITAVADQVAWGMKDSSLFWINGIYGLIYFVVTAGILSFW